MVLQQRPGGARIASARSGATPGRLHRAATALLLLAGCAVGPRYRATAPDVPSRWSALEQGAAPAASSAPAPDLHEWWKGLDDPVLSALIDEALDSAPDLRLALARVREARAQRGVASADRVPSLTAAASSTRTRPSSAVGPGAGTTTVYDAELDASWELDLWGGARRSLEASRADLEAAEADAQDARVTLVAEVAGDYYDVRAAQLRLGIARRSAESQAQTLQITEWRAQAGLVSTLDVDQARANLEQTRAQVPALELTLARAEHALDVLVGRAPGTVHARLAAGGDLPAAPARLAVGVPADAIRHRPDLRSKERTLAAETARTGVAEAARYPTLTLTGTVGVEALKPGQLLVGHGVFSSLAAGLAAPLFDAGKLRDKVQAQDAVREQAEVKVRQAVLAALQEVEDELWALARDRDRAEALARGVESARSASRLAEQRYAAGLVDFTSVLETQRTALTLEDDLASTRTEGVKALIKLYKAMGGGWTPQGDTRLPDRPSTEEGP